MKINNEKGHIHHLVLMAMAVKTPIIPAVLGFQIMFGVVGSACIWHIPAWSQAKANHTEVAYQAQKMWPQQLFSKLPGGDDYGK